MERTITIKWFEETCEEISSDVEDAVEAAIVLASMSDDAQPLQDTKFVIYTGSL
jgi:hypothetical protein